MDYKKILLGLVGTGLFFVPQVQAQVSFDFDNIDTLLTDNILDEAANRYASVLLSFQPEQATRLGFLSANERLNNHTPRQSAQMLAVLRAVKENVEKLDVKQLSKAKQVDRALLLDALNNSIWQEEQNRFEHDPLLYAQSLDAVYDLIIKSLSSPLKTRLDLTARLNQLPNVVAQAEENLTTISPYLAQLAMEKAYHAYLSADDWEKALLPNTSEEDAINQAKRTAYNAKQSVKKMFDLFKNLSQQESTTDFRLGTTDYFKILKNRYQWTEQKPALFFKSLEKQISSAQNKLTAYIEMFLEQEEMNEVTVVAEGKSEETANVSAPKKATTKKKKSKNMPLRNAQDFYAVAKSFMTVSPDENLLQTLSDEATNILNVLVEKGALAKQDMDFSIAQLPQYYAYVQPYLVVPPFGNQLSPRTDFLLRIPAGNATTQQKLWDQDFNTHTRKLMLTAELIPGRYYQAQNQLTNSFIRRLYPSKSMQNGWTIYAKRLAQRYGYISLDEDLLFLAWDEYVQALSAYVDAKIHTRQFSYTDAVNFLTQTHGIEEKQAEEMLKQIAINPGEAISYFIGANALENAHKTFSKKYGKKFNEADFNAKLLKIGNIPPNMLEKELKRLYSK